MSYLPLIDLKNGFWPVVHLLYGISEWNFTDMLNIKGYIFLVRTVTLTFPVHELSAPDWSEKWFFTCSSFTIWSIWMKLHRYVDHQGPYCIWEQQVFKWDCMDVLSHQWEPLLFPLVISWSSGNFSLTKELDIHTETLIVLTAWGLLFLCHTSYNLYIFVLSVTLFDPFHSDGLSHIYWYHISKDLSILYFEGPRTCQN